MDVKTYRSPNCDSDHYLVRVKIRQQINVTNEGRCKKPIKWDVNKLREPQIRRQHEQEISNKIDEVELSSDIELKWDSIKNINDTANQVIGNASWYDECKEAIKTKNEARSRCLARETRASRDVYEQKRKFARKICRQKKHKMINNETEALQTEIDKKEYRKFYKEVHHLTKQYKPRNINIKAKDGTLLMEECQIMEKWREYFHGEQQNVEPIEYYENESRDALEELVEPSYEEISTIIMNFRESKAPGIDNINPELIQAAGPQMNSRLVYRLVTNVWTKEKMPNEWNLALICPIYKKGEKSECSNYRGISLLNIVYKIIAAVINKRLNTYAEELIGEYQNGFHNNRATTDNIFVMHQILKNVMNITLNCISYTLILSKLLTQ
jgi:hypothetical protein